MGKIVMEYRPAVGEFQADKHNGPHGQTAFGAPTGMPVAAQPVAGGAHCDVPVVQVGVPPNVHPGIMPLQNPTPAEQEKIPPPVHVGIAAGAQ